jgi:hypothetical protein
MIAKTLIFEDFLHKFGHKQTFTSAAITQQHYARLTVGSRGVSA